METTGIDDESYEQLVQAMRTHWRREAELRAQSRPQEADREQRTGDQLFGRLVTRITRLMTGYAQRYFCGDTSLIEDGIREQIVALYKELHDLGEHTHAKLWESRFNYCMKALANALFVRNLNKRYGKSRQAADPETLEEERSYFERRQTEFITEGEAFDPIASAPDPVTSEAIARLLQRDELRSLLEAIPNPQREALWLWCLEWRQEHIAERLGCSEKTVRNWIKKATEIARNWARARYQTHGEFDRYVGS